MLDVSGKDYCGNDELGSVCGFRRVGVPFGMASVRQPLAALQPGRGIFSYKKLMQHLYLRVRHRRNVETSILSRISLEWSAETFDIYIGTEPAIKESSRLAEMSLTLIRLHIVGIP